MRHLTAVLFTTAMAAEPTALAVDQVRFVAAAGQQAALRGAVIAGSNQGETVGFTTLATIQEVPQADGAWGEIRIAHPSAFRWIKLIGPAGSYCQVAELQFLAGGTPLAGHTFGIAGTRKAGGFAKAFDGDPATWYDAPLADDAYVGLDLGTPETLTPDPVLEPAPGILAAAVQVQVRTSIPGTVVRISRDGTAPDPQTGTVLGQPLALDTGRHHVSVVATAPGRFPSAVVGGTYTIGDVPPPKGLKTFSTGNSLSDTFNGILTEVARCAGYEHRQYRFSVPGAPTEWLWQHPKTGFGDTVVKGVGSTDFVRALPAMAPLDAYISQPFSGHSRSIENESFHIGSFFALARETSPAVRLIVYQQWPSVKVDAWGKGDLPLGYGADYWKAYDFGFAGRFTGEGKALRVQIPGAKTATWEEWIANHSVYMRILRDDLARRFPGADVVICPGGPALAEIKRLQDAGEIPGMEPGQWFARHFSKDGTDFHLTSRGRYLIALTLFCTLYRVSAETVRYPADKSGLTPEQDAIYRRVAWDTVRLHPQGGIAGR
jgi:hypothetical protein